MAELGTFLIGYLMIGVVILSLALIAGERADTANPLTLLFVVLIGPVVTLLMLTVAFWRMSKHPGGGLRRFQYEIHKIHDEWEKK